MSEEVHTAETVTCLYPGCEKDAVPGRETDNPKRTGPPPRYCENEEHNVSSAFQEMKRLENEKAAD